MEQRSSVPLAHTFSGSGQRRAAVACKVCHSRKVRCNISLNGRPCGNCKRDGHPCVPHVSQRGKARHSRSLADPGIAREMTTDETSTLRKTSVETASSDNRNDDALRMSTEDLSFMPEPSTTSPTAEEDCRSNIEGYKSIFGGSLSQDSRVILFMGESQGIRSIFHACGDDTLAYTSHFWVPRVESVPLPTEDYDFLNIKGAFLLPRSQVCSELISTYFRCVHPLLPVIDPVTFLASYEHTGPRGSSILLLQSIFFAACNFIAPELVQQAGAPSAKAMKKQFYQRAKALFDLGYEKDKIPVIQSTLLLGYWFGISYDRTDGWHWTSTAINLAQTIGLHRNPTGATVPDHQRALWKRVWWCLFYRDRWTSVGMGRPLRIRLSDCDVESLGPNDLVNTPPRSPGLSEQSREMLEHCNSVAPIFAEVVNLSVMLGEVIDCQFSVQNPGAMESIRRCEAALADWYDKVDQHLRIDLSRPAGDDAASPALLYKYILNLYFQVTLITLQRPLLYRTSDDVSLSIRDRAKAKSTVAAAAGMELLRRIVDQDMIKWLPPESVTVMNSLIVICFLEKLWSSGLKKQIASQKIDLCFTIMRELSERYWAASFFLSYFEAAFERAETMATPDRDVEKERSLGNGDEPALCQVHLPTSTVQTSSITGSSLNDFGISAVLGPVQNEPGYQGLPPATFWTDFIEDFQQADNIDFDFGLDRF